jgi:hypothetical protein
MQRRTYKVRQEPGIEKLKIAYMSENITAYRKHADTTK